MVNCQIGMFVVVVEDLLLDEGSDGGLDRGLDGRTDGGLDRGTDGGTD